MDRCAETIGQKKFSRLSVRRQHELLAELARSARVICRYHDFLERYALMHTWSQLDRYQPPHWLSPEEALSEFDCFHRLCADVPDDKAPESEEPPPLSWQPRFDVTIVIDQVRSPYNVGSIIRLIDNVGFAAMVHASPWLNLQHPRLRRAARGAERWIPVRSAADLPALLQQASVPVIALENCPGAVPIEQWQPPEHCLLVVGNESYGIAAAVRDCCSQCVCIPMYGYKNSMNVHQALAIAAHRITSVLNADNRNGSIT